jgi:hypothetical protein
MVFLAEMASRIVGVEFVDQAVEEFFAERGLSPEIDTTGPNRYEAGPYRLARLYSLLSDNLRSRGYTAMTEPAFVLTRR